MEQPASPFANVLHAAMVEKLARGAAFARGKSYAESGRVKTLTRQDQRLQATVEGTRLYAVSIWISGDGVGYLCSCPAGAEGDFCKHCVAVAMEWIASSQTPTDHAEAMRTAERQPTDVDAQIRAAYACDRAGDEVAAVRYYDRAWALGIAGAERRHFQVGYGSTLRNVGRAEEAVTVLRAAVAEDPTYPALRAFLSLALLTEGDAQAAVAAMLRVALDVASGGSLDGYERALTTYQRELSGVVP